MILERGLMKLIQCATLLLFVLLSSAFANADIITIPTVPVGNVGNSNDPATDNLYGGVSYAYNIGTTEVTNAQYVAFLNAVARSDPYELYSSKMGGGIAGDPLGGISRWGSSGSYTYTIKNSDFIFPYAYATKPVVFVSWGDAARFANWLHNGQPTGAEGPGTTETGAYTLNGQLNLTTVTRNAGAKWFIPTENEWYKAAYYDPSTESYYNYPTGTNTVPNNNLPDSDTGNSANFNHVGYSYALTDAGAYTLSYSPYGTFDQGGNVWEWNEAVVLEGRRGLRGGSWQDFNDGGSWGLQASYRYSTFPTSSGFSEANYVGFRVASAAIPEPASLTLCLTGVFALAARRSRK